MNDDQRHEYLASVAAGGGVLTLSGLDIKPAFLGAIMAAMPVASDNASGQPRPTFPSAVKMDECYFDGYINMQHVKFARSCSMVNSRFRGGFEFNGSSFGHLDLRGARIEGKAGLGNVSISGDANWVGLNIAGALQFTGGIVGGRLDLSNSRISDVHIGLSTVKGRALFRKAIWGDRGVSSKEVHRVSLGSCTFEDWVDFSNAQFPYETVIGGGSKTLKSPFKVGVDFTGCTFGSKYIGGRHLLEALDLQRTTFQDVTFYGKASFAGSRFSGGLDLTRVSVKEHSDATFQAPADDEGVFPKIALDLTDVNCPNGVHLRDVKVEGTLAFTADRIEGRFDCEGLEVTDYLSVSRTNFPYSPLEIEVGQCEFTRCQFDYGGVINCSSGEVSLIECGARQPLSVVSRMPEAPTSIRSLERTDVENITFVSMDFSRTPFMNIVNLDRIDIQGSSRFPRAPQVFGRKREIILDEAIFRSAMGKSKRWHNLLQVGGGGYVTANSVAALYRSLRKNREDNKDEPGAADFYYGEMEMRRRGAPRASAERMLLTVYWLISGYALRAWRSFLVLGIVALAGGIIMHKYGYRDPAPNGGTLTFILSFLQITIGLSKAPDGVTSAGSSTLIVGRLFCPGLIALIVLALRGRLKR
jgi:uncharacterized protein YjbI with pentapeptide repeats